MQRRNVSNMCPVRLQVGMILVWISAVWWSTTSSIEVPNDLNELIDDSWEGTIIAALLLIQCYNLYRLSYIWALAVVCCIILQS